MKRAGAISVTIPVWSSEVFEFLDMKKKSGEERLRCHNLYPAINCDDVFLSRLDRLINNNEKDVTYTLFNPYDVKDLCDTFGSDFEQRYLAYEEEFKNNPDKFCPNTRIVEVRELAAAIFRSIGDVSYPYITFKDTINKLHENPELGIVRCGNLCVSGDTYLLTDQGHKEIRTLEDKIVNAWNGKKFSPVKIENTGKSEIYTVEFNGIPKIKVTPEHKFHVTFFTTTDKFKETISTLELKTYKNGIGHILTPLEDMKFSYPTDNEELLNIAKEYLDTKLISITKIQIDPRSTYAYLRVSELHNEPLYQHLISLGIDSRLYRCSYTITGVYITFKDLARLLEMIPTLSTKIIDAREIESCIKYDKTKLPIPYLKSIIKNSNIEVTYCGTEEDNNTLFFNGIHTGNCQEVMMPADEHQIAVCNLGSLNLARLNGDIDLIKNATRVLMRFLDNSIDVTDYPHPDAEKTQKIYRSTGLGSLGEAEYIANKQIHFGSEEHVKEIDRLFSVISSTALETSRDLAKEKGACGVVKDIPVRNAYRMCIAPNTQTGIFASTTAGAEPVYGIEWVEGNDKTGNIKLTAPNITMENYPYYKDAFSIDQKRLVDAVSAKQKYVDMSITFSFFVDVNENPSMKHLIELYLYAWKKQLKSVYYLRATGVKNTVKTECESCAN